jgi:hypothetical protein
MNSHIQVWDGSAWQTLWEKTDSPHTNDTEWLQEIYDMAPYANDALRVRWGWHTAQSGVWSVSGWSIDDVKIYGENFEELVGSFHLNDGPSFSDDPPTYTCLEACALVFGGDAASYQCSTLEDSIDNLAWVDTYAEPAPFCETIAAEDYKVDSVYDSSGDVSAYVSDHGCDNLNYCWQ